MQSASSVLTSLERLGGDALWSAVGADMVRRWTMKAVSKSQASKDDETNAGSPYLPHGEHSFGGGRDKESPWDAVQKRGCCVMV